MSCEKKMCWMIVLAILLVAAVISIICSANGYYPFSSITNETQNSTVNEKSDKNISIYLGSDPWTVRIYSIKHKEYYCSGFVINEYSIQSVAHCFGESKPEKIEVHLCKSSKCTEDEIVKIPEDQIEIIVHPDFDLFEKRNDIAIANLRTPLEFTDEFYPIELPEKESTMPKKLTVPVWSHGQVKKLNRKTLHVWNAGKCFHLFKKFYMLDSRRLCAGDIEYIEKGNSGLPIYLRNGKSATVFGMISFGGKVGNPSPIGFTNILSYIDWIKCKSSGWKHLDKSKICQKINEPIKDPKVLQIE